MPQIAIGNARVEAEIADTPEARKQGLAGQSDLPPNAGMLFVFDKPDHYQFWMQGMLISLDVVWISADQEVVDLTPNVPPDYPKHFTSRSPAQYVLEVPAGFVKQNGISIGDGVTL